MFIHYGLLQVELVETPSCGAQRVDHDKSCGDCRFFPKTQVCVAHTRQAENEYLPLQAEN